MFFVKRTLSQRIRKAISSLASKDINSGYRHKLLRFLADHKSIHDFLLRCIASKLCDNALDSLCHMIARSKNWGNGSSGDVSEILRSISTFTEGAKFASLKAIDELSDERKAKWVMRRLDLLEPDRKARLLKRMFYNFILTGLNRKITDLRFEATEDAFPRPSALTFAPFSNCNLDCKGCTYASYRGEESATFGQMNYAIGQAEQLNVFHVLVIGKGEPFYDENSKADMFELAKRHYYTNFIVFTNGTTLSENDLDKIRELDNMFLLVSIDGLEEINDARRGKNTYKKVMRLLQLMNDRNMLFGYSATVFRENYRQIVSPAFVHHMANMGCIMGLYVEFDPVDEKADISMMLSTSEMKEYVSLLGEINAASDIPLIDWEFIEQIHGCEAKKGHVIYIDGVTGKVSPCPKIPLSSEDCNLYVNPHKDRLQEILKTDFFTDYRHSSTECGQCSLNLSGEVDNLLHVPDISNDDRTRLAALRKKLG